MIPFSSFKHFLEYYNRSSKENAIYYLCTTSFEYVKPRNIFKRIFGIGESRVVYKMIPVKVLEYDEQTTTVKVKSLIDSEEYNVSCVMLYI